MAFLIVWKGDKNYGFHHFIDTGSPVPIHRLRVAVLDSKERVFLDVLAVPFLLTKVPVELALTSRCLAMPIIPKGSPTIIIRWGWG